MLVFHITVIYVFVGFSLTKTVIKFGIISQRIVLSAHPFNIVGFYVVILVELSRVMRKDIRHLSLQSKHFLMKTGYKKLRCMSIYCKNKNVTSG